LEDPQHTPFQPLVEGKVVSFSFLDEAKLSQCHGFFCATNILEILRSKTTNPFIAFADWCRPLF
jgi:hypothetical protein